jgi:hypothetical protein
MHAYDEFLWGGLRTRLERTGRLRPRTSSTEAVEQRPERRHAQVSFGSSKARLRPRVAAMQPARGR